MHLVSHGLVKSLLTHSCLPLNPPSQTSLSPQCSINDGAEFKAVADAMKVIGFKQEEIQTVYKIVAAILHLVSSLPMVSIPEPMRACAASSSDFPAAEALGSSGGWEGVQLTAPVVTESPCWNRALQ